MICYLKTQPYYGNKLEGGSLQIENEVRTIHLLAELRDSIHKTDVTHTKTSRITIF